MSTQQSNNCKLKRSSPFVGSSPPSDFGVRGDSVSDDDDDDLAEVADDEESDLEDEEEEDDDY